MRAFSESMIKKTVSLVVIWCVTSTLALAAEISAPGPNAPNVSMMELATTRNCLACHGVERKVLGPSFKDVAQRYADNPSAAEKLTGKVLKGGGGVWGSVPMPANPQLSEAEAAKLVTWILGMT